ncbi:unnamed protein product [Arctogadus glacialis]
MCVLHKTRHLGPEVGGSEVAAGIGGGEEAGGGGRKEARSFVSVTVSHRAYNRGAGAGRGVVRHPSAVEVTVLVVIIYEAVKCIAIAGWRASELRFWLGRHRALLETTGSAARGTQRGL